MALYLNIYSGHGHAYLKKIVLLNLLNSYCLFGWLGFLIEKTLENQHHSLRVMI